MSSTLLRTFATQSAPAIQNAQLYRELAEQSPQLETARCRKSERAVAARHPRIVRAHAKLLREQQVFVRIGLNAV